MRFPLCAALGCVYMLSPVPSRNVNFFSTLKVVTGIDLVIINTVIINWNYLVVALEMCDYIL